MQRSRVGVRVIAATAATAVIGLSAPAQAETTYDGSATALQIRGVKIELLSDFTDQLPSELNDVPTSVVIPDQTVGHSTFSGADAAVEAPDNPLVTGGVFKASSKLVGGEVVSRSSVADLNLAGGVLVAESIAASCTGNGQTITLSAPQGNLKSSALEQTQGEIELRPGTPQTLAGVGAITYNVQANNDERTGSVSNVVIDLDSRLSLAALGDLPIALIELDDTLKQVLADLRDTNPVLGQVVPADDQLDLLATDDLAKELDGVAAQLPDDPSLDGVAKLTGRVTIAAADCSQVVVSAPAAEPSDEPLSRNAPMAEPPLADTGSPAGLAVAGAAGVLALAAGVFALSRARRLRT